MKRITKCIMYYILQSGGETNEAHCKQRISDNQSKKKDCRCQNWQIKWKSMYLLYQKWKRGNQSDLLQQEKHVQRYMKHLKHYLPLKTRRK